MMINKIFIATALSILFMPLCMFSQISNVAGIGGKPLSVKQYSKIQGTPYYFGADKWYNATIYLADGQEISNIKVRYNAYADNLEYERNGDILIIESYNLRGFDFFFRNEITGELIKYKFRNGFTMSGKIQQDQFYNVIFNGEEISLLEKIYVLETTVTPASYGESSYTKFVASNKMILLRKDNVSDFKNRKRSFYNISPSNRDIIKSYIKKKDIDIKNQEDIANLLAFIEKDLL